MAEAYIHNPAPKKWEVFLKGPDFTREDYWQCIDDDLESSGSTNTSKEYLFATCEFMGVFTTRKAARAFCDEHGITY